MRRFLASPRFDRVDGAGRRGVLSLGALDDEYFGKRATPWGTAAGRLKAARMLSSADDEQIGRQRTRLPPSGR